MNYIKLIGIKINDFSSSIEFEQNYGVNNSNTYNSKKKELENEGLVCIFVNVQSNFRI